MTLSIQSFRLVVSTGILFAAATAALNAQTGSINSTLGSGGSFTVKGATSDSLLVVNDNGKIGVGTVNPAEKLDVNGNLKVRGAVRLGTGAAGDTAGTLTIVGNDGIVADGNINSGTTLSLGAGTRMMWYPRKAAFRAGWIDGTHWNDVNIGTYSVAMGGETIASGSASTALGFSSTASGYSSVALGWIASATADYSAVIGAASTASGYVSTAIGFSITASGAYSTAMGNYVSTNNKSGAFIIGDSTTSMTNSSAANEMTMRFAGGYRLFTNSPATVGASLAAGGNSWGTISDSTKKDNFRAVNAEGLLGKLARLQLGSWNYRGQDPLKFRHYGPMAQEWFAAFGHDGIGIIGTDTTLATADVDGVTLIAVQALEKRTAGMRETAATVLSLEARVKELQKENAELRARLQAVESAVRNIAAVNSGTK